MPYAIIDGRVRTRSLEAHIVDHCNLRCDGCCSLSPYLPEWYMRPEALRHDLELAGRAVSPTSFKIVGGEPLLHPQLLECLRAAKEARVGKILSVTTNGLLLRRMPDDFWRLIDAMTISIYSNPALPAETITLTEVKARRFGVTLNWKRQEKFTMMDRDAPSNDPAATRELWSGCWLRHRCHIISRGRFYACTRPPHFETYFRGEFDGSGDGVDLRASLGLAREVQAYLLRQEPLAACYLCRVGDAEMRPHRQLASRRPCMPRGTSR